MKLVTAVVRPAKLDETRNALSGLGFRVLPSRRCRASDGKGGTASFTGAPSKP